MARCLGKREGLARLTSLERLDCQPLKTATGWLVANFSPQCLDVLARLCPGDTDVATIPNPVDLTVTRRRTTFPGGPGEGSFPTRPPRTRNPFEGGPTGQPSGGGGGTAPEWACTLFLGRASCDYVDLVNAGIDIFRGGDDEPPADTSLPGTGLDAPMNGGGGPCEFPAVQIGDKCVDITAALPGGEPLVSAAGGTPVRGLYGAGFAPVMETRDHRTCPPGFVLGKDNVCYDHLPRSKRKWDPGMKPLLTGGDRAAIRKAATAARKLKRAKKQLKKSARALEKVS